MDNDSFKEVEFCKDCERFKECDSSQYGTNLLMQYMIFTSLKDTDSSIDEKFDTIFKNLNYTKEEIEEFMENKKDNCVYYNSGKDI